MTHLLYGLGIAVGVLLLARLIRLGRRWRLLRRRVLWENALKQICSAKHEARPVTRSEIANRLGLSSSAMLRLTLALESAGLLRSQAGVPELTEAGERLGVQVLRGHRLLERYLSSESQLPLDQLHGVAERAEHHLAAEEIDALADHLGHPRVDPHGDAIPTAAGQFKATPRVPLTDWPLQRLAVVAHVEDEPRQALNEALRAGLNPGTVFRVVGRDATAITCETPAGLCTLAPAIAAGIDVRAAAEGEEFGKLPVTLAALPLGDEAEVVELSEQCTGLSRRRLLDLGFTPGAKVTAVLANLGDSDHAYEIRGTVMALRKEQAAQVLIRPLAAAADEARNRQRASS
jgi:DtxR family Mn-dependent transcriptional regulator